MLGTFMLEIESRGCVLARAVFVEAMRLRTLRKSRRLLRSFRTTPMKGQKRGTMGKHTTPHGVQSFLSPTSMSTAFQNVTSAVTFMITCSADAHCRRASAERKQRPSPDSFSSGLVGFVLERRDSTRALLFYHSSFTLHMTPHLSQVP